MRRAHRIAIVATAASLAALFVGTTMSEARPRKPTHTLTVRRRPFTDSGQVVPVGTESHYVGDVGYNGRNSTLGMSPRSYGGETLPGRFELPNTGGLFNF